MGLIRGSEGESLRSRGAGDEGVVVSFTLSERPPSRSPPPVYRLPKVVVQYQPYFELLL